MWYSVVWQTEWAPQRTVDTPSAQNRVLESPVIITATRVNPAKDAFCSNGVSVFPPIVIG